MVFAANTYGLTTPATANFNAVANAVDGAITSHWGGTTGGSTNAYTLSPNPAWTAATRPELRYIFFTPHATNTGATTFNISGLGPATATYKNQACVGGELVANVESVMVWDGTNLEILVHGGGWATWTPTFTANTGTYTAAASMARFQRHGNRVDFAIAASGTTSAAAQELRFTPPITAANTSYRGGGFVFDGINPYSAFWAQVSTTVMHVSRYDYASLGAGANRTIQVQGFYEV